MDATGRSRLLLVGRSVFCCAFLCFLCQGCASQSTDVVYTKSIDPNIENGYVTEVATISIDPLWILRLPESALVERSGEGKIEVRQRKELNVVGHPPDKISIKTVRTRMGAVARLDSGVLEIDTFGTYQLDGAGGANIAITCIVPEKTVIERSESKGMKRTDAEKLDKAKLSEGHNTIEQATNWIILQNSK
jgi:hypothetical protein